MLPWLGTCLAQLEGLTSTSWAAETGGGTVSHLLNIEAGCHGCASGTVALPGVCHICVVPRGPLDHPAASKEAATYVLQQKMQCD